MTSIVDYGVGNVAAFVHAFKRFGATLHRASTPEAIEAANRLILPGVGSFDWAMQKLDAAGLVQPLRAAHAKRVPVLGICVGMQMLARRSDEGRLPGLGWLDAEVRRLPGALPLPHMGWNDVGPAGTSSMFAGMERPRFYFLHSYHFDPAGQDLVAGTAEYGKPFCAAVAKGNVWGVQFHPEKSHDWGLRLLQNFAEAPFA